MTIRTASPAVSRQAPKKADAASAPLIEPTVMIAALTGLIGDRDAAVRAAAVRALWEFSATDPAAGLPSSTRALKDEDPGVRIAAAEAVGQLISHAIKNRTAENEARAAAPELLASLKDPQANVRNAAIGALTMVGTTSPGGARRESTNSGSPRESNPGSEASVPLIDAGELATVFTALLGDQETSVRLAAVRALGRLQPSAISQAAVPPLVAALQSRDSEFRYEVILVLSRLGPKAGSAILAFIAALKEPAETDRALAAAGAPVRANARTGPAYVAAEALGKIAPRTSSAGKAVAALAEVVASGPAGRRPAAASALGQFGAEAVPAIPALVKMLRDTEKPDDADDDRSSAAAALGRIAPGTPSAATAVAALTDALKSKSAETRAAAAKALERFGPKERQGTP